MRFEEFAGGRVFELDLAGWDVFVQDELFLDGVLANFDAGSFLTS